MKWQLKVYLLSAIALLQSADVFSQESNAPGDYLPASFHAERRQALRNLMPAHSVAVIFSYPEEVFSRDNDYKYHANPDLYYFSGYKEPNAVLLIFKETQVSGDSSFDELFFVQHRDPKAEQWTGKRLGVDGVKKTLGFKNVYNGEDFGNFKLDLRGFGIISDILPVSRAEDAGELGWLVKQFQLKTDIRQIDGQLAEDLNMIYVRGNINNINRLWSSIKPRINTPAYKNNLLIELLAASQDSNALNGFRKKYEEEVNGTILFNRYTNALRGIKTKDEIRLIQNAVELSGIAHAEAMRAINPDMSERQLEGIMLYIHKKHGSEDEAYAPIVGAGANGCILHYEENNLKHVGNQLVLIDVGAEYHGYAADITRTFPANGKFTEEQKAIYQIVFDAQEAVFKICREGISFDSIQRKSEEVVADGLIRLGIIKQRKEMKAYYPHSVTHHLGLDVHDKGNYRNLMENMVITVEPGIYIPAGSKCDQKWWDIGVRIEDDVLIGKDNSTVLSTAAPRQWEEVEKTIAEKSIFDEIRE